MHGLLKLDRKASTYHRLGDEERAGYETPASTAAAAEFTRQLAPTHHGRIGSDPPLRDRQDT